MDATMQKVNEIADRRKAAPVSDWPQRMKRKEAMAYLGVTNSIFTELMTSGQLAYIKFSEKRASIRFDKTDLDRLMERKKRRMA
jgi:excisionase family DNA binding protein